MSAKMAALAMTFVLAGMAVGAPAGHAADKTAPASFATVDVQFLLQNSEAAKSARSQIEQLRSSYQLALKGEQDNLTKLNQSIEKERTVLSQGALQEKMQDLRQKAADYQRDAQERQGELNRALSDASVQIERKIVAITETVKKEHGYAAVLNRSALVGAADLPDVTQEVMGQLNSQLPSVTVEVPNPAEASKAAKPAAKPAK